MRYNFRRLLLALTVLGLIIQSAMPVLAQNPTGSIRGTVIDEPGAVIQKANVTVTSKSTGEARKVTTNEEGVYTVDNLLPGDYDVKIEASGFSTVSEQVTVQVGNTASGNATLRVGAANIVVDVVTAAPQID